MTLCDSNTKKGLDPSKPLRRTRYGDRERFCQELIAGTALYPAYRSAGFGEEGDVRGNAQRLESDPDVQARLTYLRGRLEEYEITALALRRIKMRRWLESVVETDRLAMYAEDTLRADLEPHERSLIEGIEPTRFGAKYIMPSKLAAQAQLAKLDGLDKPIKAEVTGKDGGPIVPKIILTGRPEAA